MSRVDAGTDNNPPLAFELAWLHYSLLEIGFLI